MIQYIVLGVSGAIVIGTLAYVIKTYNNLVYLRMNADRQASHVEVHLKKKFDMIPALVEIVKGYAGHEKGTLEEVVRLRSQWGAAKDINQKVKVSNSLEGLLSRLLVVQERYPKLKADRGFNNIQRSIYYVEKELTNERKVYNKRISWYNVKLETFPSNLVASIFRFQKKEFFRIKNETD